ncbi:prolipoprotein diacylglyceryl transferase, partial [Patescibacteria group bacterium]|nr:prolipoprotein diacylglyceryl transferase [Patescibacteria group bacterium]
IPALIGYCIGLVGAFLGGFAYGKPTELPWGVTYQIQNVKYTVPVHPIQIYAIIAVTLLLLSKKRLKDKTEFFNREGNTTIYLSTGFSLIYFLLEFLKGDDTLLIQGIRIPMIIAAMVFITSGIALAYRYKSFKNEST